MFNDAKDSRNSLQLGFLFRILYYCCSQHVAPGSLVRMNISLR